MKEVIQQMVPADAVTECVPDDCEAKECDSVEHDGDCTDLMRNALMVYR
jgi:hypothetical protein